MAKVSFAKLGLKVNNEVKTFEWLSGDEVTTVEVKQYLPIEEKLAVISNIINNSIDDNGNTDGGIVVFYPGEEKIKNNDICAINSDFDTGYDFEQKENNYNEDGSIRVPKALQPYMGGKEILK